MLIKSDKNDLSQLKTNGVNAFLFLMASLSKLYENRGKKGRGGKDLSILTIK